MASRPVKLKLLPRTTVKAKSMTRLPVRILGGDGILVDRAAGTWTVSVDADNLPAVVGLVIGVDVQAQDSDLQALADNATNGIWARTATGTGSARTLTGTANRLTVTNGDGVSGNPTFDLSTSYVGQATITTLGTIATGVWQATKIGLAYGGTNADLSATGGTSQVLKQVSAGAAVTVGQLATTDLTGLGTGVATFLATPSSANLRAALTDETGTGSAYFQGGNLGTPSAGVLTSATGLPLTTGVTGVLPVANFATGTPTGSKFVRDDGVLAVPAGAGDMLKANNLSDLVSANTARTNLGIGPCPIGGRITLTTGVAVTASDVTGAGFVFLTASGGQFVPVYDGTDWREIDISTDISITLDSDSGHTNYHQSGKNFDVFAVLDSGTSRIVTGPAWSSDTSRGTGAGTTEVELKNGVLVNKNALSNARFGSGSGNVVASVSAQRATLLATIRMTANGVTEDSFVKRFVSNLSNTIQREMLRVDTTDSWNYSTVPPTWQQANASASNQIEWVHCVSGRPLVADVLGYALNSTATLRNVAVGIGIDSTTVNSAQRPLKYTVSNAALLSPQAFYNGYPGIGYHKAVWLEAGAGADTQTWFGDAGGGINSSPPVQSGIAGRIDN